MEFSRKANIALLDFNESEHSVSLILPELYRPLLIPQWPEDIWLCRAGNVMDLRAYGFDSAFPELHVDDFKLTFPTRLSTESFKVFGASRDFMIQFRGAYDKAEADRLMSANVDDVIEDRRSEFGRRVFIEWHITDAWGNFVGFIHLSKKYKAFLNRWSLEFGLLPSCQHRGIMGRSLSAVLSWAKRQGCTEIYAMSEVFNEKSHAVFVRLSDRYQIHTQQATMSDSCAGNRLMNVYLIKL